MFTLAWCSFNVAFAAFMKDHPAQVMLREVFEHGMRQRLNNNEGLIKKIVPDFAFGCRRPTPGDGYLEALQEKNASCISDPILRITDSGFETSGGIENFDIIVCATGFDVTYKPHWNTVGQNGISLNEKWAEDPHGYFGICAPDMPNYFTFLGPNSPVAHGSLIFFINCVAQYILKWCKKIATEDIRYVSFSGILQNPN